MKIIYAMAAIYPYGSAYASRVLNFCRMLTYMGHEVFVFCDYLSKDVAKITENEAVYETVKIHYLTTERTLIDKLTVMYRTPTELDKFLDKEKVDLVITSASSNRLQRVLRIVKAHSVPVVIDTCEKFHYSNWTLGRFDYRYYQFLRCWKHCYHEADGIIAISSYLQKHFSSKGLITVRIPTILDVKNMVWKENRCDNEHINFVFIGGLGNGKDRLVEFIEAMYQLKGKTKHKAVLNVYGPSEAEAVKQMQKKASILRELGNTVRFCGKIPQRDVPEAIQNNDFGIIIRPDRESSHAGFPTKLAEYMSVGTPVVANNTSDIGKYIQNGKNGYLIKEGTTDKIVQVLREILNIDIDDLNEMRKQARKTAEESFDYPLYADVLSGLIIDCVNKSL